MYVYILPVCLTSLFITGSNPEPQLRDYGDGRLTVRSVKVSMDGEIGSLGALMLQDYVPPFELSPGNRGLMRLQYDEYLNFSRLWSDCGYQVGFCVFTCYPLCFVAIILCFGDDRSLNRSGSHQVSGNTVLNPNFQKSSTLWVILLQLGLSHDRINVKENACAALLDAVTPMILRVVGVIISLSTQSTLSPLTVTSCNSCRHCHTCHTCFHPPTLHICPSCGRRVPLFCAINAYEVV